MRNAAVFAWCLVLFLMAVAPSYGEDTPAPTVYASCEDALFNPDYGVFKDEGGYQNASWDTGNFYKGKNCGGTKYGIACGFNQGWLRSLGVSIKDITKKQAAERYQRGECAEIRIDKLKGRRNPALLLGLAVNQGSGTAILNLKHARNAVRRIDDLPPLPVDTTMDDDTIEWYNAWTADPHRRLEVLFALELLAIDRAADIVELNPRQSVNLLGWVDRWDSLNFQMPAKKKALLPPPAVKKKK